MHPIRASAEIDQAFLDAGDAGVDSLFVIPSRLTSIIAERIATYARQRRLPVMTAWREFADAGCLMSYGPSRINESRRLAVYVERMLAGATPAALPIEQPTKFELVVNLRTAKTIGIAIPQQILLRADEVIE